MAESMNGTPGKSCYGRTVVKQGTGALFPVTNTIDTYVYRGLLELGKITLSASAGFYQSMVGFILIMTTNLVVRKVDSDSALF